MTMRQTFARFGEFESDERAFQALIAGHAELAGTLSEGE